MPDAQIVLTDAARAMLARYFQANAPGRIRLEFAEGGCAGPRLQLRLDEGPEQLNDALVPCEGYQFVVDRALLEAAAPVTIDATRLTFSISSRLQLEGPGCGTCKGCS